MASEIRALKDDWDKLDLLVFKHSNSNEAIKPDSYEELEKLLNDVDSVYSFNRVETMLHGAIGYDVIIEE